MGLFKRTRAIYERILRLSRLDKLRPDLSSIISLVNPDGSLNNHILWLESLLDWVRIPITPLPGKSKDQKIEEVRVRFFLQWLDRNPEYLKKTSKVLTSILLETDQVSLFCQTGLSREGGFVSEVIERLFRKVLPKPIDDRDFSDLFARLFNSAEDALWLEGLSPELLAKIVALVCTTDETTEHLGAHFRLSMADALLVMGSQLSASGLYNEIRQRSNHKLVLHSPFFILNKKIIEIHDSLFAGISQAQALAIYTECHELFASCRREIQSVISHLDEHGVSVAIVYRLELLDQLLTRCEMLLLILLGDGQSETIKTWQILISSLIRSKVANTQVRPLFRENLHLVSRKIAERSGHSGEHYITHTAREYFAMMFSAAGGGLLTVFTAYVKFFVHGLDLAVFFESFFYGLNYATSFLIMQALHFTLATKQPSFTAPALAHRLKAIHDRAQLSDLVTDIARITRSNFASALGNVGMVIPGVILFDWVYYHAIGSHVVSAPAGVKVIESLHPFTSLTLFYAALTGVILWFASIVAGWFENWFVFRQIPESIEQSTVLRRFVGAPGAERISAWISRNISGIAGNVSIGFLLATPTLFGRFFGVPLDVRHVTLSTGSFIFAVCGIWQTGVFAWKPIFWALGGLVGVGVLNFGVSFFLALNVAITARHVKKGWLTHLRRLLLQRFVHRPLEFFWPVREK